MKDLSYITHFSKVVSDSAIGSRILGILMAVELAPKHKEKQNLLLPRIAAIASETA